MRNITGDTSTSNSIRSLEAQNPKLRHPDAGSKKELEKLRSTLQDNPRPSDSRKLSKHFKSIKLPSWNTLNNICRKTADNLSKVAGGLLNKSARPHGAATQKPQEAEEKVDPQATLEQVNRQKRRYSKPPGLETIIEETAKDMVEKKVRFADSVVIKDSNTPQKSNHLSGANRPRQNIGAEASRASLDRNTFNSLQFSLNEKAAKMEEIAKKAEMKANDSDEITLSIYDDDDLEQPRRARVSDEITLSIYDDD